MALLDDIFASALQQGASDVHLGAGSKPYFRVEGLARQETWSALSAEDLKKITLHILTDDLSERFNKRNDIDFSFTHKDTLRLRAHAYWERERANFAFRFLPLTIPEPKDLNIPASVQDFVDNTAQGLFLVTGASGSGKSTTIASLLNALNEKHSYHIITIEDPIEYIHSNKKSLFKQREVGRYAGDVKSFPQALRSALREDPDVIFVGEMRDLETMRLALRAAETGHLVFSTLHTAQTSQIPARIVSMFPASEQARIKGQLAYVLGGAIAQQLHRKKEGGLIVAFEVMLTNSAIRNLILEEKWQGIRDIIKMSSAEGMILMEDAIAQLKNADII